MEIQEIEIHEFEDEIEDVGQRDDGEAVYSPGSTMNSRMYVLTIRTSDGEEGHYRGQMHTQTAVPQIKQVAPRIIGRDPLEREDIWQDIWWALRHTGHIGVGPIDIALWDLAGHHFDESVSSLMGGGHQNRVQAYASTISGNPEQDDPETYADFAEQCFNEGYQAFKIHPFGDPDADIRICRAVADRVGDRMKLMLDPSSAYRSYTNAVRVGRVLDECGFFWYEDPMRETGESIYAMQRLTREIETSVLGIEHSRTGIFGSMNHMMNDALDMVRVDVHFDGGLTGALKIAHACEAAGFEVEPHVGGPAHLHLVGTVPNSNYFEHGLLHPKLDSDWVNHQGYINQFEKINSDGTISIPDGPGLGVEIDWDYVRNNQVDHTKIQ